MNKRSVLSRANYEEFLVRLYFGAEGDYLSRCIARAYLDFSRTLHGLGKFADKDILRQRAEDVLRQALEALKHDAEAARSPAGFDAWHRTTCQQLAEVYGEHGSYQLFVGQAQKWINLALKYLYVMGEQRIPGYGNLYPYAHVPLDGQVLEQLAGYGLPALPGAWSRLNDYDAYLAVQQWIRQHFVLVPLDVEFLLGMGQTLETLR